MEAGGIGEGEEKGVRYVLLYTYNTLLCNMWALIFLSCCLSVCQQRCHLVHFCVLSEVLDPRGAGSVVVLTGVELHLCQEGIPPGGGRNLRSSLSLRGRTWKTLNCCLASFFLSFFLSLPCMNLKCALLSRHLEQNH